MSTIEITTKIAALKELEDLIEEAKAEAETLRDEIKNEMLNRNTEEMEAGQLLHGVVLLFCLTGGSGHCIMLVSTPLVVVVRLFACLLWSVVTQGAFLMRWRSDGWRSAW